LTQKDIHSVKANEPVIEGLKKLSNCISSVAVLDPETGALVDCLCASDLRGLTENSDDLMSMNTLEFIEATKQKMSTEGNNRCHGNPLVSPPNMQLRVVVEKMLDHHTRRVWVTNYDRKPVGVVTLTDIFIALKQHQAARE